MLEDCAITFVMCVSMQYSVLLVPVVGAIGGCGTGLVPFGGADVACAITFVMCVSMQYSVLLVPVGGAGVGGCGTGFVQ